MNILVLCPHFEPDIAPTGEVMTTIANGLVAQGHRLHVITALPWYRHHRIEPGWQGRAIRAQDTDWGRITRVHPFPTNKANIPARAAAFGAYTALVTAVGLVGRRGPKPQLVLAMSPPITLGVAGWLVARRHRVPYVFNVQDIFPDVAVELGAITNQRLIAAASWLERFIYRHADAVTVLSDELARNVSAKLDRGRPPGRKTQVRVIPNFVDTTLVQVGNPDNDYRREHDLVGRTVVMYAGNVGLSQSLDLVVGAARALEHSHPDVCFVFNGEGSGRAELQRSAAGLGNVRFVDYQPKERLAEVLAAGDLHLVPLRRGLAHASVPSKLYSILAAGRPVLASVDPGTEVARTIDSAGAGVAVGPEDQQAFVAALRDLLARRDQWASMGAAGRSFVQGWASPAAVAGAYGALFEELRDRR
ncbi:MAG: glycosyltransferase family 4 protein [Acidimicrobiales bacterium]